MLSLQCVHVHMQTNLDCGVLQGKGKLCWGVHALHLPVARPMCCCRPACKHTCSSNPWVTKCCICSLMLSIGIVIISSLQMMQEKHLHANPTCSNYLLDTYSKIEVCSILCNEIRHCMLAKVHARVF